MTSTKPTATKKGGGYGGSMGSFSLPSSGREDVAHLTGRCREKDLRLNSKSMMNEDDIRAACDTNPNDIVFLVSQTVFEQQKEL